MLIPLPQGGCLIDTPGMRELKLSGEEVFADGGFEDIEALSRAMPLQRLRPHQRARLRDPRARSNRATLDEVRYASYIKLRDERDAAAVTLAQRRAEAKELQKAYQKRSKDKLGRR